MDRKQQQEILQLFFRDGASSQEIAEQTKTDRQTVAEVLSDETLLEPYRREMEAARLRAQLVVTGSAENAARVQRAMLDTEGGSETARQRAAKDILDRAGVAAVGKDPQMKICFPGGEILLGMPKSSE